MVMDMTVGKPIRSILRFFVPVLLGNLLQQVYSMTDSAIVSHFLGVKAFAGVSATGSLNFLILGFALGLCGGFAIPVSQEFGAGNRPEMRRCFANALYASAVLSLALGALTAIFTPQILRLVGTPEDIFVYARDYIRWIFIGIPATVLYNLLSGVMRAVGDGKTPLYMLIFSCVLNIALDYLCVVPLNMGIAGAAIATVLSQLMAGLMCLVIIFKKTEALKIRGEEWKFSGRIIRRELGIGLPMGLQFSITAIGSTLLQSAVNGLGSSAVAAIGAGAKVQFLFTTPTEAVGVTMATYCGQNLGARKIDRVKKGVIQITLIMLGYSVFAFLMQMLFGEQIAHLFIDASQTEILQNVRLFLNIVVSCTFLLSIVLIFRNSIQGLGYSRVAMLAGLMELAGRGFVAMVLVKKYGFPGACVANPVAWIAADLLLVPLLIRIIKKYEKLYPAKD